MLRLRKILLCDWLYYLLLVIAVIYLIIFFSNYKIDHIYEEDETDFILTISNYKIDGNKLSLSFKEKLVGTYYFKNYEEKEAFINKYSLGDIINVKGILNKPTNNTIPNTFNYKDYLKHKNIEYYLIIESYSIKKSNNKLFKRIKNYIYRRINNINNNTYIYACILGDSSHIDESIYNNYKTNGITHLFALSGLHVSLFSSFILFILNKLKFGEKKTFVIISSFLLFYSYIASFSPSILRATLFFILSNINKIYYFFIKQKYLLFVTFIIMVLINPNYIYNYGFILSFTITFFIIMYNENHNKSSILRISIISFLSSIPIIINMSYEINIVGFFNNVLFIPFVTYLVFPCALLTLIIPKLNIILKVLTNIMEFISGLSTYVLNIGISIQRITTIEIIIYYLLFVIIIKNSKKIYKILFIIFILFIYFKPLIFNNNLVYFIDVGQGDSTLIIDHNKSILIDTGGKTSYYEESWAKKNNTYNQMISSIIPFMKSIGIKELDYLILTHGDYDHMGDAMNLIENFKVKEVILNCGEINSLERNLISLLEERNINYNVCIKELDINGNQMLFLQTTNYGNENDNSNVIYYEIDGIKFLFMGDAGIEKEADILNKYKLSNIDVLKVGHHGSKTSSSELFINKIKPNYSIISVGKNNKYGHPNNEVLNVLNDSIIYRTDIDGSIGLEINNGFQIETYSP